MGHHLASVMETRVLAPQAMALTTPLSLKSSRQRGVPLTLDDGSPLPWPRWGGRELPRRQRRMYVIGPRAVQPQLTGSAPPASVVRALSLSRRLIDLWG